jgi:hypothetical protein
MFATPRRRIGPAEALLSRTLRAWTLEGVLTGDAWASARGVLRDAARAVDRARADMMDGEGSAYSFARCNELFRAAMDSYRSGEEVPGRDAFDDFLADLNAPPVRDETQP